MHQNDNRTPGFMNFNAIALHKQSRRTSVLHLAYVVQCDVTKHALFITVAHAIQPQQVNE